jgi:hypothetical protein
VLIRHPFAIRRAAPPWRRRSQRAPQSSHPSRCTHTSTSSQQEPTSGAPCRHSYAGQTTQTTLLQGALRAHRHSHAPSFADRPHPLPPITLQNPTTQATTACISQSPVDRLAAALLLHRSPSRTLCFPVPRMTMTTIPPCQSAHSWHRTTDHARTSTPNRHAALPFPDSTQISTDKPAFVDADRPRLHIRTRLTQNSSLLLRPAPKSEPLPGVLPHACHASRDRKRTGACVNHGTPRTCVFYAWRAGWCQARVSLAGTLADGRMSELCYHGTCLCFTVTKSGPGVCTPTTSGGFRLSQRLSELLSNRRVSAVLRDRLLRAAMRAYCD